MGHYPTMKYIYFFKYGLPGGWVNRHHLSEYHYPSLHNWQHLYTQVKLLKSNISLTFMNIPLVHSMKVPHNHGTRPKLMHIYYLILGIFDWRDSRINTCMRSISV